MTASALAAPCSGLADQAAGVDAVDALGDRAQRAGQPEPAGDDVGDLDRRRGHQPDPLPGVEVQLRQRVGAGPDLVGHDLVVDLLADRRQLGDGVARDERQGGLADLLQVVQALADGPERASAARPSAPMSRRLKNLRRYRPRARWKMLAPRTTVLSTSKNAAAVGSGGTAISRSTACSTCAAPVTGPG